MKVATSLVVVLSFLAFLPQVEAKKRTTNLRIVVENREGEPVPRASVIVRTLKKKEGRKVKDSLQLRTSQEGTAPLPPLRQGWVIIQVIADGYQTWGGKVELNEPEQTVRVTLRPPQDQFSVHEDQESSGP